MHSRLEQYLDEVDRRLEALPSWERREWREEAQAHLQALADAHQELGRTPEEAVEAAILQFGDAERLGQELRRTSLSVRQEARESSRQLAWSTHALAWFTAVSIGSINLWLFGIHRAQELGSRGGLWTPTAILVFWLGLALGGALLGWGSGRRSLGRFVLAGYALLLGAALVLTGTTAVISPLSALVTFGAVGVGLRLASRACRWASEKCNTPQRLARR